MDNSSIIKRINKYKAVSFDIFDTLLKRDVFRPSDVFRIVQTEAQERYEIDIDFKALRINAEKTAREKSQYPDNSGKGKVKSIGTGSRKPDSSLQLFL